MAQGTGKGGVCDEIKGLNLKGLDLKELMERKITLLTELLQLSNNKDIMRLLSPEEIEWFI